MVCHLQFEIKLPCLRLLGTSKPHPAHFPFILCSQLSSSPELGTNCFSPYLARFSKKNLTNESVCIEACICLPGSPLRGFDPMWLPDGFLFSFDCCTKLQLVLGNPDTCSGIENKSEGCYCWNICMPFAMELVKNHIFTFLVITRAYSYFTA